MLAATPIKIQGNSKSSNEVRLKRARVIPEATLLYTDSSNLPASLSQNTLLFTTDTRELYIGSGNGISRVNLGSDGAIIDKSDYLTKKQLAELYIQKVNLDPKSVITKQNIGDYIQEVQNAIKALVNDNAYKADKEEIYTKQETNDRFIDIEKFALEQNKKVDKEVSSTYGSYSYMINDSTGARLRFNDISNNVVSKIETSRKGIEISSVQSQASGDNNQVFGGRIFVTHTGAFFTNTSNDEYDNDDKLVTASAISEIESRLDTIESQLTQGLRQVTQAYESADLSSKAVAAIRDDANNALAQAENALAQLKTLTGTVGTISNDIDTINTNVLSSLNQSTQALNASALAQQNTGNALSYIQTLGNDISSQVTNLEGKIDSISGIEPTPSGDVEETYRVITQLEEFTGIHSVDYQTQEKDLSLPGTLNVTLDDGTVTTVTAKWYTSVFEPGNTAGYQSIIGHPVETEDIKNTRNLFTVYKIQVLPQDNIDTPTDDYVWGETFVLPRMTTEIKNFPNFIKHYSLSSTDLMGNEDSLGNYVNPLGELMLLGSLNRAQTFTEPEVLTQNDVDRLLNTQLISVYPEGVQVPISNLASSEEIDSFKTKVATAARLVTNGGFIYGDGVLSFDQGVDSDMLYRVRMKKRG